MKFNYLPVRGRIKEAARENYNISLPLNAYLQLLITKFLHANTFCDKQSSTSEQALWEINKLYTCNNKDTILRYHTHSGV